MSKDEKWVICFSSATSNFSVYFLDVINLCVYDWAHRPSVECTCKHDAKGLTFTRTHIVLVPRTQIYVPTPNHNIPQDIYFLHAVCGHLKRMNPVNSFFPVEQWHNHTLTHQQTHSQNMHVFSCWMRCWLSLNGLVARLVTLSPSFPWCWSCRVVSSGPEENNQIDKHPSTNPIKGSSCLKSIHSLRITFTLPNQRVRTADQKLLWRETHNTQK